MQKFKLLPNGEADVPQIPYFAGSVVVHVSYAFFYDYSE